MAINNLKNKWLCDMVIYFPEKFALIAIELKDWKNNVTMSTAKKEFEGYRYIFDYFYLIAPKFSKKLIDSEELTKNGLFKMGLIQINRDLELLKKSEVLLDAHKSIEGDYGRYLFVRNEVNKKTELKIIREPFQLCVYSNLREDFLRRLKINWNHNKKGLLEKYPFAKFKIPPKTKDRIEDKNSKLSQFMEAKT